MPNTANYSFPTPADTDLVKNGADAIRDLGDAVDTAMNTALGTKKSGLVLLNTTSFSGVSSQSFNNVFNATYDNYQLIFVGVNTASNQRVRVRLRASGTDATGSDYHFVEFYAEGASISGTRISTTSFDAGSIPTTNQSLNKFFIYRPFASVNTVFESFNIDNASTTTERFFQFAGFHNQATSYDGFTIFPASGTLTGTLRLYGYNN